MIPGKSGYSIFLNDLVFSDEDTSDEAFEKRHAIMEKEEYTKLMPLVNPRLYKSTLNKEMKQKRKEA